MPRFSLQSIQTISFQIAIERAEEQKLLTKYGQGHVAPHSGAGGGGHSAFLQKRLAKGQKFFDSGDYQMAKQVIAFYPSTRDTVSRKFYV